MRAPSLGAFGATALLALPACQPAPPLAPSPPPPPATNAPPPAPSPTLAPAEPGIPPHVHVKDVIYGRKYGMSLTLDVFQPPKQNGAAIVALDTGGWKTDHDHIWAGSYVHYLSRGYTVFRVVHGSAPKFNVVEQVADVRRAVKFVRYHAAEYHVDPGRIGITGDSAGGYLSVMMGVTGKADPGANDPVERVSPRVQAVGVFCPPTDFSQVKLQGKRPLLWAFTFLDFTEKPRSRGMLSKGVDPGVSPGMVRIVTDADKGSEILREASPIEQADASAAPTMVIQGDKDQAVPVEDTRRFIAKLGSLGVPAKLVIVPGAPHAVPNAIQRTAELADWFDAHLKPREKR
jgi:acetyl esterase/lipase